MLIVGTVISYSPAILYSPALSSLAQILHGIINHKTLQSCYHEWTKFYTYIDHRLVDKLNLGPTDKKATK